MLFRFLHPVVNEDIASWIKKMLNNNNKSNYLRSKSIYSLVKCGIWEREKERARGEAKYKRLPFESSQLSPTRDHYPYWNKCFTVFFLLYNKGKKATFSFCTVQQLQYLRTYYVSYRGIKIRWFEDFNLEFQTCHISMCMPSGSVAQPIPPRVKPTGVQVIIDPQVDTARWSSSL